MGYYKKLGLWAGGGVGGILLVALGVSRLIRILDRPLTATEASFGNGAATVIAWTIVGGLFYVAWLLIKRFTDAPRKGKR